MAYQEQRTFEPWKTNRIFFSNPTAIRVGSNGDFEQWSWDRFHWYDYVEVEIVPPPPPPPPVPRIVVGAPPRVREKLESSGIMEMFEFWRDYFRDVFGFTDAHARVRAEELMWIARWDDEDLIDLEIL